MSVRDRGPYIGGSTWIGMCAQPRLHVVAAGRTATAAATATAHAVRPVAVQLYVVHHEVRLDVFEPHVA